MIVINGSHSAASTHIVAVSGLTAAVGAGVGGVAGGEEEAHLLQGEAVPAVVGEVLTCLRVLTQLSALLNVDDSSNTVQQIVTVSLTEDVV